MPSALQTRSNGPLGPKPGFSEDMKLLTRYTVASKRLQADPSAVFSDSRPLVFLLRHGQIQGHGTRRFIGQTEIPLDETGISQALFWKKAFKTIEFDQIFSSTLSRCFDTSNLICPGKPILSDPRLNEINLGTWEGHSFDHIQKTQAQAFKQRGKQVDSFRPPGGESFNDLYDRVSPFFNDLNKPLEKPLLVVTHSGVIRVILGHILGLEPDQWFTLKLGYSDLFLLETQ